MQLSHVQKLQQAYYISWKKQCLLLTELLFLGEGGGGKKYILSD